MEADQDPLVEDNGLPGPMFHFHVSSRDYNSHGFHGFHFHAFHSPRLRSRARRSGVHHARRLRRGGGGSRDEAELLAPSAQGLPAHPVSKGKRVSWVHGEVEVNRSNKNALKPK